MGSAVLEATYFVLLASAYRRGGLSLVYPLARGSAPLIAVVVGIGVLGEQLVPLALVGVAFLLAGILLVSRPWQALRTTDPAHRAAIGFALLTGASIAAYSTVDRLGVREAPPWLYGAILAVGSSILTFTVVTIGRRRGWLARAAAPRPGAPTGLWALGRDAAAGVLSLTAYLLVLLAYSIAPLATVAPLRESGIVLAAAWGAIRLREAKGRRDAGSRVAAAALVVIGAALLAAAR
jgi:drug/metabolite transporter (DMT)-like permease